MSACQNPPSPPISPSSMQKLPPSCHRGGGRWIWTRRGVFSGLSGQTVSFRDLLGNEGKILPISAPGSISPIRMIRRMIRHSPDELMGLSAVFTTNSMETVVRCSTEARKDGYSLRQSADRSCRSVARDLLAEVRPEASYVSANSTACLPTWIASSPPTRVTPR